MNRISDYFDDEPQELQHQLTPEEEAKLIDYCNWLQQEMGTLYATIDTLQTWAQDVLDKLIVIEAQLTNLVQSE